MKKALSYIAGTVVYYFINVSGFYLYENFGTKGSGINIWLGAAATTILSVLILVICLWQNRV